MIKHYDDLIVSKTVKDKDYSFSNPTFGKSNTDQSYYEPMASMFQNAQKSGSVSSSFHNDAEKSIAEVRANADFLPQNMTQEETNAMIVRQREIVEGSIQDVNNQINNIKDEINLKDQIVQNSTEEAE